MTTPQPIETYITVSYTHLDVYKRQVSGSAPSSVSPETQAGDTPAKPAGKDDYLRQKEEQAKERKRQNQIKRVENRISEIENRINALDELLTQDDVATDVKRLMEINEEHELLDEELLELMEEWETLIDG